MRRWNEQHADDGRVTSSSPHYRHLLEHKSPSVCGSAFFKTCSRSTERTRRISFSSHRSLDTFNRSSSIDDSLASFLVVDFSFRPEDGALGNIYLALLYFIISLYTKVQEGCKSGGGDVEVVPGVSGDCFQLCFTRFLGGPIGGICWVAKARKASAIRCGWEFTMDLKPTVSITSVACLQER